MAIIFDKTIQTLEHKECTLNQTCDLKSLELYTYKWKINFSDSKWPSFGTTTYFKYKTQEINQLENYAFVQFIKGCRFSSTMNNGKLEKSLSDKREFFGELIPYRHPEWVIDSVDIDPMYHNTPINDQDKVPTRHAIYMHNQKENSYDENSKLYFYQAIPSRPELYSRDLPSTVWAIPNHLGQLEAMNNSLFFKTCLFKTSDIPKEGSPNSLLPENALHCFEWSSSWIFDFKTKQYTHPKEIDPFCLE